jgi:hypothetical protein
MACATRAKPGRSDSEFPAIPELNALIPGLGNRIRQPNFKFASQLGFALDPTDKGKTSIRGGIGLFYENVLTSVSPTDPLFRAPLANVFVQTPAACLGFANPQTIHTASGDLQPTFCGSFAEGPVAIGVAASQIVAFQKQYQAASPPHRPKRRIEGQSHSGDRVPPHTTIIRRHPRCLPPLPAEYCLAGKRMQLPAGWPR